jgi:hypothetical protein
LDIVAIDTEHVICPECGTEIGFMVKINSQEWLNVNGIAVRAMHGVCLSCGAPFHWSVSERMLAELISKVLAMRQE